MSHTQLLPHLSEIGMVAMNETVMEKKSHDYLRIT